ncbi:MAG: hypothetical protein IJB20_12710 [Clostridia bacterium]|nr:hypothetical protein [Clostridia bacterium]
MKNARWAFFFLLPRRGVSLLSFAQAVEKSFENLPQTTDIFPSTVGNIVGNSTLSAYSAKSEQTPPEFHETSTEDFEFSTFSEKFSTEETPAEKILPVEKSSVLPNRKGHPFRMTFSHVYSFSIVI